MKNILKPSFLYEKYSKTYFFVWKKSKTLYITIIYLSGVTSINYYEEAGKVIIVTGHDDGTIKKVDGIIIYYKFIYIIYILYWYHKFN